MEDAFKIGRLVVRFAPASFLFGVDTRFSIAFYFWPFQIILLPTMRGK